MGYNRIGMRQTYRGYTGGIQGAYRGFTGGKAPTWEIMAARTPTQSVLAASRDVAKTSASRASEDGGDAVRRPRPANNRLPIVPRLRASTRLSKSRLCNS